MHEKYFEEAATVAKHATCYRARCGSVIVSKKNVIIGRGFNAPPLGDETQRTCDVEYHTDKKPKSDKTCCVHAEWNAIIDALKNYPEEIEGSTLYFMRIAGDNSFTEAGDPYCTVCSRLALQSGIEWFGLWNGGPQMIDTKKYNRLSYDFYR
ncbi:hypothetical protein H7X69_01750 [Candidatus Saccharibacteria bacterium]|nr:hypothetical protein [Candidatus Saccharibacteria bacterium]